MKTALSTAVLAIGILTMLGTPTLMAQTKPQDPMGSGIKGDGMMQKSKPNMSDQDMNKMMADCDKMMKDKGMKMPGNMHQMMDQCSKMMNGPGDQPKAK